MQDSPNILLIVVDQFRADLLADGPLGRIARLPNLRALMAEAVTFPRHYSVTSPCGPSRVSLLTGQYAMNHRAVRNGTPLRHDTPNIATAARAAGRVPLLFGYTDTAQDPRVLPPDDPRLRDYEELMPGFEEVVRTRMETDNSQWREWLAARGNPLPDYPQIYRPDGDRIDAPAQYSAEESDTAFLTHRFLEEMASAPPGWFATLTYLRPHPPLVAPAPYNSMYDPADMPPPATTAMPGGDRDWHPFLAPAQDHVPVSGIVEGFPDLKPTPEVVATLRALYLALATEVDHHIGRVVDWLKSSGQWDNTVLVVTGDHGEMLGDYGLWGKSSFHDAAFHVPLILRDPARPETHGATAAAMTESIDIAPTLLQRMGAEVPDSMNGQSLLPLLDEPDGAAAASRGLSMSEYDFGNPVRPSVWMRRLGLRSREANFAVLRRGPHRLVQFAADLPPVLFDMDHDAEARDLAGDPAAAPLLLEMTQAMLRHRMRNPDGTFARTLIRYGGVHRGDA